MAGINKKFPISVPAPGNINDSDMASTREQAARFVESSTDSAPTSWRSPLDGKAWKKSERSPYNLLLSPPQKEALTLVAALNHQSVQEFVALLIEDTLLKELARNAAPEVGGRFSHEATMVHAYLSKWGDLAAGRNSPGR